MAVAVRIRSDSVPLPEPQIGIEHAVDRLVDAGQGVIEKQVELARLELGLMIARIVRGAAILAVGTALLALAAALGIATAYAAFPPEWPPAQRLGVLAGACAVLGAGLAALGARRLRAHGGD